MLLCFLIIITFRAFLGTRTPDLLITNELLYQLSYFGNRARVHTLFLRNGGKQCPSGQRGAKVVIKSYSSSKVRKNSSKSSSRCSRRGVSSRV